MTPPDPLQVPRSGMFATVRNRRGVVAAVEPYGDEGRLRLVYLEYKDDQFPPEEQLLCELEPRRTLLEPTALPNPVTTDPMPSEDPALIHKLMGHRPRGRTVIRPSSIRGDNS